MITRKAYRIESIKLALMYYSAEKAPQKWMKEIMKKHEWQMIKLLYDYYQAPI